MPSKRTVLKPSLSAHGKEFSPSDTHTVCVSTTTCTYLHMETHMFIGIHTCTNAQAPTGQLDKGAWLGHTVQFHSLEPLSPAYPPLPSLLSQALTSFSLLLRPHPTFQDASCPVHPWHQAGATTLQGHPVLSLWGRTSSCRTRTSPHGPCL